MKKQETIQLKMPRCLKLYIDLNIQLINNSIFLNNIQNNRKETCTRPVTNKKTRNTSSPRFRDVKNISDNLKKIEMTINQVEMEKLIYISETMLDLSKTLI